MVARSSVIAADQDLPCDEHPSDRLPSTPMTLRPCLPLILVLGCTAQGGPNEAKPADAAQEPASKTAAGADDPGVLSAFQRAQVRSACVQMQSYAQAVEMFRISEGGRCPASVAELAAARMIPQAEADPWKSDYLIECKGEAVTLRSGGPDGVLDNDDDLAVGASTKGCEA